MIVPGICRGCYSFDEGTNETWPGSGVYCYMFKCAIMPRSWDSKGWLKSEVYVTLAIPEHCGRTEDHETANRLREL